VEKLVKYVKKNAGTTSELKEKCVKHETAIEGELIQN
jgi:hypothetical protein